MLSDNISNNTNADVCSEWLNSRVDILLSYLASHHNSDLYMKNYVSSECLCNLDPIHCPNGDILAHTFGLYVKTEKVYGFQTQPHCGDCRLSASES